MRKLSASLSDHRLYPPRFKSVNPSATIPDRRSVPDLLIGLLLATVATLIINLPLWNALRSSDEWRFPDIVIESSDELFYLSRIREVTDGHPMIGNPVLFERRDQAYPLGQLWERILALPMQFFGVGIKTVSITADAVFPVILILLTWMLSRSVLPEKRWRLLLIATIFLGSQLPLWKRIISPQETFVLPLLYLWLFLHPKRADFLRTIIRSTLIAIMVLSYPFHWTYCAVAEAVLFVSRWKDDRSMTIRWKRGCAAALPFLLLALPGLIRMLTLGHDPAYAEMLSRLGLIDRHLPVGPLLLVQLLILLGLLRWFLRRSEEDDARSMLSLLLIAGVLVLCQPVITGKEAEFGNHYGRILAFPLLLGGIFLLRSVAKRWKIIGIALAMMLTIWLSMTTISTSLREWKQFDASKPSLEKREELKTLIMILNSLPREQVILTLPPFAPLLTTYTSHYPFTAYEAYMYMAPDSEIVERARLQNLLTPSSPLSLRAVMGTRYDNRMLYERTLCRLRNLLLLYGQNCAAIKTDLAEAPSLTFAHPPTSAAILKELQEKHVSFVLLPKAPALIRRFLVPINQVGDWTLFQLTDKKGS